MATLKDVAALAGVSAATVSLYLNGKAAGRISAQKQKEIEEALKQLRYQPTSASRQLKELEKGPRRYTIAVYWASDPRSALLDKVMGGIQASMLKNHTENFNIVIYPYKTNELHRHNSLIDPWLYSYDAAIIANTGAADMQYLNSIRPTIPVVLLNRRLDNYSSVYIDNHGMGGSLADLIAEKGCKSVAVFRSQLPYLAVDERVAGFIDRCRQLKLELPNHALIYTDNSTDGGIRAAQTYLALARQPEVVFCDSDLIALGALYAFYQAGVRIPEDLPLVSIGHRNPACQCSIPPLTMAEIPLSEMAEGCMDAVTELLLNPSSRDTLIQRELPTEITMRESFPL